MTKAEAGLPAALGNHPRVRIPSLSATFFFDSAKQLEIPRSQ